MWKISRKCDTKSANKIRNESRTSQSKNLWKKRRIKKCSTNQIVRGSCSSSGCKSRSPNFKPIKIKYFSRTEDISRFINWQTNWITNECYCKLTKNYLKIQRIIIKPRIKFSFRCPNRQKQWNQTKIGHPKWKR